MSTDMTGPATAADRGAAGLRVLLVVLAVGQFVSGVPITGTAGVLGQLAVLAGAAATAVAVVVWSGGLLPYAAAVVWAFVAVAVGAARASEPVLTGGAVVGLVAVGVVLTVVRRRRPA